MTNEWLDKPCKRCKANIYYLKQWKKIPVYCDACRASSVKDNLTLLQDYFAKRKDRPLRPDEGEHYALWLKDMELSRRLDLTIKKLGKTNRKNILAEILTEKRNVKIILQLEKERRIKKTGGRGETAPYKITSVVSGGLPS